jgi:hypothetical protein
MIHFTRCWTGRYWIDIGNGLFAIGFGPTYFIERMFFNNKLVILNGKIKWQNAQN